MTRIATSVKVVVALCLIVLLLFSSRASLPDTPTEDELTETFRRICTATTDGTTKCGQDDYACARIQSITECMTWMRCHYECQVLHRNDVGTCGDYRCVSNSDHHLVTCLLACNE